MANQSQMRAAVVLLLMQSTLTNTAKNIARPVHEVINEQARVDDKRPFLPYSNPLALTANAQLHAQHQQAMFNAERVRQHRAQLQRLNKITKPVDSYMKAYQESQENHQLALEQMQSNLNKRPRRPEVKSLQAKETKEIQVTEKNNRGTVTEKNRNHRSYGSVLYIPQNKGKIRVLPGPTYDQGVTIKPNGNIGLNQLHDDEKFLYTAAVPSKTEYIYPKYTDTLNYQSLQDIQALNYLLTKPAHEQLNGFNNLVQTNEPDNNILEKPIDLYFYLKDTPVQDKFSQQYPRPYAAKYLPDYNKEKPITEDVEDVEDPNKVKKVVPYGIQPVVTPMNVETATVKANYYTIEHAVNEDQLKNLGYSTQYSTINENDNPHITLPEIQNAQYTVQEKPAVQYGFVQDQPKHEKLILPKPIPHFNTLKAEVTEYIKHQPQGVQHLNQDGTGTSAYGNDEVQYAANYEFGYRVKDHETGSDFGHQEHKSGEKTKGSYHVLLPDGRMQMVKYSAGPSGYHADISYDHLQ